MASLSCVEARVASNSLLYQDDHGGDDVADDNLDSSFLLENTKVACVDVPKVVDAEAVHVVVAQVILVIKDDHHQSKLSHIYMHITFITPLSAQNSASKFQNLSRIPLKKLTQNFENSLKILKLTQNFKTHSKF